MRSDGKLIARRMHALKVALEALAIDAKLASEVAFNLADMEKDLTQLLDIIENASRTGRLDAKEVLNLAILVDSHTKYHFDNLRRSLKRTAAVLGRKMAARTRSS